MADINKLLALARYARHWETTCWRVTIRIDFLLALAQGA